MFAASKTASVSGGYQISRSLRFNSADSAYLSQSTSRSPTSTSITFSFWIKISGLSADQTFVWSNPAAGFLLLQYSGTDNYLYVYNDSGGSDANAAKSNGVLRDVSAWYHIVYSRASSSNGTLYINSVAQTQQSTNTANVDFFADSSRRIGLRANGTKPLNGYVTEFNCIDGQALTPSSFGETNAQTSVWGPKAYSGSYGTNGFYLNFSDNSNTTAATLGKDYSGNGNNWTPNNFSVTAGAGNDSLVDSPTSYGTDTGVGGTVRGNYATLNPLDKSQYVVAPVNGNLDVLNTGNFVEDRFVGTIAVNSGKWYFETTITGTYANTQIGIHDANSAASTNTMYRTYVNSGQKISGSTATSYGNSFTTNDILGVAVDMDSGKIWFSKNGTFQASGDPVAGTNAAFTDLSGTITPLAVDYAQAANGTSGHNLNFGQRPFAYTAPSGFKALCTQNLPTPTIGATTATQAGKFFNPVLYTGTGSSLGVTGVGFQPDWVWVKGRSGATDHGLYDAVRGVQKQLKSNTTDAETTETTGITAFGSDGFTTGALAQLNTSSATYVAWNWKANGSGSTNTSGSITSTVSASTTSGFSVVTYTGTGANATVGHGLGVAPSVVIVKSRSNVLVWTFGHISIGFDKFLVLNTTAATTTASSVWQNTAPSSTVFTIGNAGGVNTSSATYVAYCFAPVTGFSAFGSYTGNGSTDGPFVFTGIRPAYLLIKRTDTTDQWTIFDNTRSPSNVAGKILYANLSNAEDTSTDGVDMLSNGFKVRATFSNINASGGTFIYMALAQNPFKYSLAR
jgi:hypothetical protein